MVEGTVNEYRKRAIQALNLIDDVFFKRRKRILKQKIKRGGIEKVSGEKEL